MSSATLGNLFDGGWATAGDDGEIAVTDPSDVDSPVAVVAAMGPDETTGRVAAVLRPRQDRCGEVGQS